MRKLVEVTFAMPTFLPLFCLLAAAPATPAEPAAPLDDEALAARAKALLGPVKKELQEVATRALAKGADGGVAQFAKESQQAFKIAAPKGVTLGWTSLQLRNEKNAPRPWVRTLLRDFKLAAPGSTTAKVVELENGRKGYAEAIWMGGACVTCHGDPIPQAWDDKLTQKYPKDESKGLWLNDLRGAYWVEFDVPALSAK